MEKRRGKDFLIRVVTIFFLKTEVDDVGFELAIFSIDDIPNNNRYKKLILKHTYAQPGLLGTAVYSIQAD